MPAPKNAYHAGDLAKAVKPKTGKKLLLLEPSTSSWNIVLQALTNIIHKWKSGWQIQIPHDSIILLKSFSFVTDDLEAGRDRYDAFGGVNEGRPRLHPLWEHAADDHLHILAMDSGRQVLENRF